MAANRKRNHARAGLTLIELIIVTALLAMSLTIVTMSIDSITGAKLQASASGIAGSIRFTYDLAARKNVPFRIVFDLDEQSYWVESSSEKFLLDREKTEVRDGVAEEKEEEEERSRRFVSRSTIEGGEMWEPKRKASFSSFAGPLSEKVQLAYDPQDDTGIKITDVWVAHQTNAITEGQAYLYCFPTGMTERAMIHIGEEDDVYSIEVEALTGRVKIHSQYVDIMD